jgi:hypothetical protein
MAGWHLLLLDVDADSLHSLRGAIDVLAAVEELGDDNAHAQEIVRLKFAEIDRRDLVNGLLVLSHLFGEQLGKTHGTSVKSVLTGLRDHVDQETTRRG